MTLSQLVSKSPLIFLIHRKSRKFQYLCIFQPDAICMISLKKKNQWANSESNIKVVKNQKMIALQRYLGAT